MSDNDKLQKKVSEPLKEKIQYGLAFGVIATMLMVAQFPMFIIIFFGIFAYFLWKTFAAPSPTGTREIFEFYLSANEVLRDDERRWFGFEIQETITRGERILQMMNGAPPLVYFTLGALYHKAGDHKSAVSHLAYVLENENADEKKFLNASPELKNYVRILRKIEREPAEAPQTSAAVRALERARRNRGKALLEESRVVVTELDRKKREELEAAAEELKKLSLAEANTGAKKIPASVTAVIEEEAVSEKHEPEAEPQQQKTAIPEAKAAAAKSESNSNGNAAAKKQKTKRENFAAAQRQPISELLRDIYDEK